VLYVCSRLDDEMKCLSIMDDSFRLEAAATVNFGV
jgi:hypothetical protein